MPNRRKKDKLLKFNKYSKELQSMGYSADTFICPACLKHFSRKDIEDGLISYAHVFPRYIKRIPKVVLVCGECDRKQGRLSFFAKKYPLKENCIERTICYSLFLNLFWEQGYKYIFSKEANILRNKFNSICK
jgi:hypothetical protein